MDINKNMKEYLSERSVTGRYASFDFCYNYFQSFYEAGKVEALTYKDNMEMSCLQLGFYLSSWGMLRGSSFILQKSVKHFEKVIGVVASLDSSYWQIDVDKYTDANIEKLFTIRDMIKKAISIDGKCATNTLITKIMLGIFGCVPALDRNFCAAFKLSNCFGEKVVDTISKYYIENKETIDNYLIKTIDFCTGQDTGRIYTKAKVIDMIGFVEGESL